MPDEVLLKGDMKLHQLQQDKREKEEKLWVLPQPCLICHKILHAPHGRHEEGWTCCGAHEREWNEKKESLIDYVIPASNTACG